jgi:hypothetical protein
MILASHMIGKDPILTLSILKLLMLILDQANICSNSECFLRSVEVSSFKLFIKIRKVKLSSLIHNMSMLNQ